MCLCPASDMVAIATLQRGVPRGTVLCNHIDCDVVRRGAEARQHHTGTGLPTRNPDATGRSVHNVMHGGYKQTGQNAHASAGNAALRASEQGGINMHDRVLFIGGRNTVALSEECSRHVFKTS
jgi:hypothetical protein